jgi:plastocyanin
LVRYFWLLAVAFAAAGGPASISLAKDRCHAGSAGCRALQPVSDRVRDEARDDLDNSTVHIARFLFTPEKLAVAPGTTVTWTNLDNSPHQVSVKGKALRSGIILKGRSGSLTFTEPGTYE